MPNLNALVSPILAWNGRDLKEESDEESGGLTGGMVEDGILSRLKVQKARQMGLKTRYGRKSVSIPLGTVSINPKC